MVLEAAPLSQDSPYLNCAPNLPGRIRKKFAVYCADYFVR